MVLLNFFQVTVYFYGGNNQRSEQRTRQKGPVGETAKLESSGECEILGPSNSGIALCHTHLLWRF